MIIEKQKSQFFRDNFASIRTSKHFSVRIIEFAEFLFIFIVFGQYFQRI